MFEDFGDEYAFGFGQFLEGGGLADVGAQTGDWFDFEHLELAEHFADGEDGFS